MSLAGARVVVTRARTQAGKLADLLERHGAVVVECPTIEVAPPETWDEVDDSIRSLARGDYEWVVFTSANGVEKFTSRLGCMPDEVFHSTKVAAVGSTTRSVLEDRGVRVDLTPDSYTAVDLAKALGQGNGLVLLPRAAVTPPDMVDELRSAGWDPHEVAAYRTMTASGDGPGPAQVRAGGFDAVTFTSASTVRGFVDLVGDADLGLAPDARGPVVACIGPVTAAACEEGGLRVDVVAKLHTAEGLVAALAGEMGT